MCLFATDKTVEKYIHKFPHLTFKRWHPFVVNVLQEEVSKSLAIVKVLHSILVLINRRLLRLVMVRMT
jgi:hypothetical protein